jgi:hypothetical protein
VLTRDRAPAALTPPAICPGRGGSRADRLLRHGVAPVLLVGASGGPVALEHAVVPRDGATCAEGGRSVWSLRWHATCCA